MVIVLLKGRLPDGGSVHLDNVGAMVLVSEVEDIIVIGLEEQSQSGRRRIESGAWIELDYVGLTSRSSVQVGYLDLEAGRANHSLHQGLNADVLNLNFEWFQMSSTVLVHRILQKGCIMVCICLHVRTGQEPEVHDYCTGHIFVVEGFHQKVIAGAIEDGVNRLLKQFNCDFAEIHIHEIRKSCVREQVVECSQSSNFGLDFSPVAQLTEYFEVKEGDCSPTAISVAFHRSKEVVSRVEGGSLLCIDGIRIGVLRTESRDGIFSANEWTLNVRRVVI